MGYQLFKDDYSIWRIGFSQVIGVCSLVEAELWGVYVKFMHAWQMGVRRIVLETDNLEAVSLITKQSSGSWSTAAKMPIMALVSILSQPPNEVLGIIQDNIEGYTVIRVVFI
ncbi:hypothetical protein Goari_023411 [Gossypium aridum]|uniref:RNase H type-1 domain-containing protein n=1 Tax=Gossypium aridum TaxID=34290 RepID=A0A7J8X341_GOSAI|nr:hypothetical protein [Gossypium aridum]